MSIPEAFVLLTLPNTTLSFSGVIQTGVLNLDCVTVQVPNSSNPVNRDVYLVLHLSSIEIPLDPERAIHTTDDQGHRVYTIFDPTMSGSPEIVISVALPSPPETNLVLLEDLATFETILAQYAAAFHGTPYATDVKVSATLHANELIGSGFPGAYGDLRGHLVVVNEENGEVMAQFDKSTFDLKEDPQIHEHGHENDAVIIEVPDNRPGDEQDATALQMFVRAVPPDQQDWITKSATVVSHAISTTTNLLLTAITTASDYYISHSKPSPHHSTSSSPAGTPALPPRALVFLTSERTRKGLAGVHAISSQAVKVSSKTVSIIDTMIRRATGSKPKQERLFSNLATTDKLAPAPSYPGISSPPLPPRMPSPSYAHLSPPPGFAGQPAPSTDGRPPLPPRRSPSSANPLPPRASSGSSDNPTIVAPRPHAPLSKKERILLSADLILSTIDHDTRRLLDTGTTSISSIMGHKYGPEAAETSQLLAGTARNAGLVYVDLRGIGRRAILKRAGKQFIKGRISSNKCKTPQYSLEDQRRGMD
ncbi:hypothetical protein C0993_006084 [Termitomyces sp. T159_Od127]|nr:hypothetical protein C0993_006084 [Termitomyces sp. T159_Od127]